MNSNFYYYLFRAVISVIFIILNIIWFFQNIYTDLIGSIAFGILTLIWFYLGLRAIIEMEKESSPVSFG